VVIIVRNLETEKYVNMYSGKLGKSYYRLHNEEYGDGVWCKGIIEFIKTLNIQSICDVGCGKGRFCHLINDFIPIIYGIDIASVTTLKVFENGKIKFLDGEAKSIPLKDSEVEWITSFDCLEHCPPEDIDDIFKEFIRVASKGIILSISDLEDVHDNVILHLTVKSQEWWYEKIKKFGKISLIETVPNTLQPYIICEFNKKL